MIDGAPSAAPGAKRQGGDFKNAEAPAACWIPIFQIRPWRSEPVLARAANLRHRSLITIKVYQLAGEKLAGNQLYGEPYPPILQGTPARRRSKNKQKTPGLKKSV